MRKSEAELAAAGFIYLNTGTCKGKRCRQSVLWFGTRDGRALPLDVGTLEPHQKSCRDREQFQRPRRKARAEPQLPLFYQDPS